MVSNVRHCQRRIVYLHHVFRRVSHLPRLRGPAMFFENGSNGRLRPPFRVPLARANVFYRRASLPLAIMRVGIICHGGGLFIRCVILIRQPRRCYLGALGPAPRVQGLMRSFHGQVVRRLSPRINAASSLATRLLRKRIRRSRWSTEVGAGAGRIGHFNVHSRLQVTFRQSRRGQATEQRSPPFITCKLYCPTRDRGRVNAPIQRSVSTRPVLEASFRLPGFVSMEDR